MTNKQAIYCVENFALYHAKGDLPYSARTLEALKMAIKALKEKDMYECKDDCICDDCTMCIRWNKLADCYQTEPY